MSNVLDEIRAAVRPDAILECVENTYRPELNGSLRVVTSVRRASYKWRPLGVPDAAPSWGELPTRVRDVTGSMTDGGSPSPNARRTRSRSESSPTAPLGRSDRDRDADVPATAE